MKKKLPELEHRKMLIKATEMLSHRLHSFHILDDEWKWYNLTGSEYPTRPDFRPSAEPGVKENSSYEEEEEAY